MNGEFEASAEHTRDVREGYGDPKPEVLFVNTETHEVLLALQTEAEVDALLSGDPEVVQRRQQAFSEGEK